MTVDARQVIADVLRRHGWTCEYHEPPEPTRVGVAEWIGNWGSLWVTRPFQRRGEPAGRRIVPRPHSDYSPEEARALVAALLAAAKTAEEADDA